MANKRGQGIDKTHLSVDQAETRGFLHRDYIAHCLRWSHVIKRLQERKAYKEARILDIGCGKEAPLAKTLHSMRMAPTDGYYIGLDVNRMDTPAQFANTAWQPEIYGHTDIASEDVSVVPYPQPTDGDEEPVDVLDVHDHVYELPTHIVCFEVLEHVEPEHCVRILKRILEASITFETRIFISTPNWDPRVGAAANHVNEMRHDVLGGLLEELGFEIVARYGTFASIKDYQHLLSNYELDKAFVELRKYYDTNLLACVFAPLFPAAARNCLWELRKPSIQRERVFAPLSTCDTPWSSSDDWEDLKEEICGS